MGIIANNEPVVVAAYAISGLISGILNKFGKIGVIGGFILGNIVLSYFANGMVISIVLFKEILIAGIALIAVPKNINLNIENILIGKKFLPIGANRGLNKSKETVNKLNNISKAVEAMATSYKNVAATAITKEDLREKNKQKFIAELLNNLDNMEENLLYEIISNVEGNIVDEIFSHLMENQFIKEKDLIRILAKNNNYVVGFDQDEKGIEEDIQKMTNAINSAYRISKMNFIWSIRLDEEKKNFETQLNGVSHAISGLAKDLDDELQEENLNLEEKEQIITILKQKEILVQDIFINTNDRCKVELYIEKNEIKDAQKQILDVLNKILKEKFEIKQETEIKSENLIKYEIIAQDKYILSVGISSKTKENMPVSGDGFLKTKLKDGKYLLAISDGMGSGIKARESSQIVISMLQRLLNSGFEKQTSIELINSNLLNTQEETFATLDIAILDLYKGNMEFIKNGAMPTYIKQNKKVQVIKSKTLPTGIVKELNADVFDKDLENEQIIVMCSDGILDSNIEYKNKELWLKYLLEDIEITTPQKIADIILNEAIDNNYGKIKDDMTVIVFKIVKK